MRYESYGGDTGAVFALANGAKIRCCRTGEDDSGPASFGHATEHGNAPGHAFVVGLAAGTRDFHVPKANAEYFY